MTFPELRLRRLRRTSKLRALVKETTLNPSDFIFPLFVKEGLRRPEPIQAMPGQFQWPLQDVIREADELVSLDIPAVILFGIPSVKDGIATSAYDEDGVIQQALRALKENVGDELVVVTDVCLCEYMSHGHCGIVEGGRLLNDPTLELLRKVAVSHAEAGADIVAPSGMIDGQVQAIREALDGEGFEDVGIMAYSAKHASHFYGPFREAAESAPTFGDRRGYQMDYANPNEALRETRLDVREGADIIMVKPALAYLDIILRVKKEFGMPTAAYNVSGEYAMIKAAAAKGWIKERPLVLEVLTAIKRAGADMIITYSAKEATRWLREE